MPHELRLQSLVVDAVRGAGGVAFKLSNKFLVGIPDLFVYLPGLGSGIWEVKSADIAKMDGWYAERLQRFVKVKLSGLQDKFLRDMSSKGGLCGVISFIESKTNDYVAVYSYETLAYGDAMIQPFIVSSRGYSLLERGAREATIVKLMEKAYGRTD